MDLLFATKFLASAREAFAGSSAAAALEDEEPRWQFTPIGTLGLFVLIMVSVYAFYLSWSCNTVLGYSLLMRILFGLIAALFGLTYLIFYLIMRWDTCSYIFAAAPKAITTTAPAAAATMSSSTFTY